MLVSIRSDSSRQYLAMVSKNGRIVSCRFDSSEVRINRGELPLHLNRLAEVLQGKVYGDLTGQLKFECGDERVQDVILWMSDAMEQ